MADFGSETPWWTKPNGWDEVVKKLVMRRCGHCKADITTGHGHSVTRGLCRDCLPVFDDFIVREAKRLETERAAKLRASTVVSAPEPAQIQEIPPPEESGEYRPSMPDFSDMADEDDRWDDAGSF